MVFGDGASGHKGETFMNGISAFILIKETPESSLAPYIMWGHSKKTDFYEVRSGFSPDTKIILKNIFDEIVKRIPTTGRGRDEVATASSQAD